MKLLSYLVALSFVVKGDETKSGQTLLIQDKGQVQPNHHTSS